MASPLSLKLPRITVGPRTRYLLITTAALSLMLVSVRFLYLPVIARIRHQHAAFQDLQVKMADVERVKEELPKQEIALHALQGRYQLLYTRFGNHQSIARILEGLDSLAKTKRLQLVAKQSVADQSTEQLIHLGPEIALHEIPLSIQLIGRYRQIAEFLGELDTAPFVASVKHLSLIKPGGENTRLQADLVLAVYVAEQMPTP